MQHAHAFVPVQDGRIYIEKLNGPFLFGDKATPAEYSAGLAYAIERGWLTMHESGTSVRLNQAGAGPYSPEARPGRARPRRGFGGWGEAG